jgi:Sulfotransferase family
MTQPHSTHAQHALSFDSILTLAERDSGAYGVAGDGLKARVKAMLDWINERGPYRADQLDAMRGQLVRLLANRLRIADDRQRHPGIQAEKIERPLFIIGFARSGTTLLHSLLAEDPEVLAPLSLHSHSPSPPPGAVPVCAGRMAYVDRMVQQWSDFCPAQTRMHPYIDLGARQLIEDEELFTLDFRNAYPYHLYRVPSLDPGFIILGNDQTSAFRFHRELLQHLQWNTGRRRWVCKGPSAQHHLDALFEVYPDALCVWPHRPLGDIYASNIALRAAVYDTIRGRPNDWSEQAMTHAQGMKAAFDRLMTSSLIDDPRIMHVTFRDVAADPVGVVKQIYARQELALPPAVERRLRNWLADPANQVDRYGRYPYSYEAFGLQKQKVDELFADYSRRFGL